MFKNSQKRMEDIIPADFSATPYTDKQLSTAVLTSGQGYQRPIQAKNVQGIINNFNPMLLDPIIVNFRVGKYYVIDGQHRIVALKKMNNGRECMVQCKVLSGLTYEQEALLYHQLDASKRKLSLADDTRALAESGEDEGVREIQKAMRLNGFVWNLDKNGSGCTNNINSVRAVLNAYKQLGYDGLYRTLRIIRKTWGGKPSSLSSYIISGAALFVKAYENEMDDKVFVRQLSKLQPDEIVSRGRSDSSTRNQALKYARVILSAYNRALRNGVLSYKLE